MECAKECVTTHLPNQLALKMDGAGALDLYWAIGAMQARQGLYAPMSRRVMVVGAEALGASLGEATTGADLGGSSKYSNENFED